MVQASRQTWKNNFKKIHKKKIENSDPVYFPGVGTLSRICFLLCGSVSNLKKEYRAGRVPAFIITGKLGKEVENMKKIEISKAPQAMRIEAIKGLRSFDDVWELDSIAADTWQEIFEGVEKGIYNYASWDAAPITSKSGSVSFLRHGLTRSIKEPDKLQLTYILVRDDEEIPLNYLQVNLYEFLKETPTNAKVIVE